MSLQTNAKAGAALLPFLMVVSLMCSITAEEFLGYQAVPQGEGEASSYALLLGSQVAFAGILVALGPRIKTIVGRIPLLVAGGAAFLIGALLALAGSSEALPCLTVIGFVFLSLGSFSLKISCLELLSGAPPKRMAIYVFLAAFTQSFFAPMFTLSSTVTWIMAGLTGAVGFACVAGVDLLTKRCLAKAADGTSQTSFRRPFLPAPAILVGVGVLCASISFLNPLPLYPAIDPLSFIAFTFLSHIGGALLFALVVFVGRGSSYATAFKSLNTLVLVGFFLMALFGAGSSVPRALCTTAFSLFEFVTFLAIADLASYSSTDRLRLFGGYYLLMRACALVGVYLNADDVVFAGFGLSFSLFGSLFAVACVVAAIWLITEPNLSRFFWGNTAEEIGRVACNDEGEGVPVPAPSARAAASLIEHSVEHLAVEHGLTPREQEVFTLMAQGRSSTFISEELFVSTNTVRKHIAHVYEKLGVHSRQELLTLVQQESLG